MVLVAVTAEDLRFVSLTDEEGLCLSEDAVRKGQITQQRIDVSWENLDAVIPHGDFIDYKGNLVTVEKLFVAVQRTAVGTILRSEGLYNSFKDQPRKALQAVYELAVENLEANERYRREWNRKHNSGGLMPSKRVKLSTAWDNDHVDWENKN
jgi:hypothetical protein